MNPTFQDFKQNKDILTFTISDCDVSLVNALRRIILTDVQTIGFNTDDYENSDLKVITNTSSLHNEFLLHRLGLIPIYTDNVEKYDTSLYKFILKIKNTSDSIIDITTKDIEIINMITNTPEDNNKFFKANDITGDHILITKLKPNPDGNGEEIHIEGNSSKGVGSSHIRFSPVSKLCFTNKIDPKRIEEELSNYLKENNDSDTQENLIKRFNIEESERCYYINDNGDPNVFDFIIETKGILKPYKILIEGIKALIKKLQNFNFNLDALLKREKSSIEITEIMGLMKGYDLVINNESHTLGFLIQSYINMIYYKDDIIIGYMNPHPLEKKIKFRIKSEHENITQVNEIFKESSNYLITKLNLIKNDLLKRFEKKIMFKPQKKKT